MRPLNGDALVLLAPAKVNLGLRVLGRRPDGFHEIDTLCMALELCDRLEVRAGVPGEGVRLELSGPMAAGIPTGEDNLAVRAVRSAQELARERGLALRDLDLRLEKRVPAAAGLGGGSADAAAALVGAARAFGISGDDAGLEPALARLGSDCVFFRAARATGLARCRGRGELVEPLFGVALPWSVVLVTPSFGCSTASVYRALRELAPSRSAGTAGDVRALLTASPAELVEHLANDLEPAALRVAPELAALRAWLAELAPRTFVLSGSGSSFFALQPDSERAARLLERVRAEAKARRCALRGAWSLRPRGRGVSPDDAKSQSGDRGTACNP